MNAKYVKGHQPPPEPDTIVVEMSREEAANLVQVGDVVAGPLAYSLYIASDNLDSLTRMRDILRRLSGAIRYAEHG